MNKRRNIQAIDIHQEEIDLKSLSKLNVIIMHQAHSQADRPERIMGEGGGSVRLHEQSRSPALVRGCNEIFEPEWCF
jgi:hypothetical protein